MTDDHQRVDIIAENASEFRVYVVQYWSHRRNGRVREYADAIPEADLVLMPSENRQKVAQYARMNLGLDPAPTPAFTPLAANASKPAVCTPSACAACRPPCHR